MAYVCNHYQRIKQSRHQRQQRPLQFVQLFVIRQIKVCGHMLYAHATEGSSFF